MLGILCDLPHLPQQNCNICADYKQHLLRHDELVYMHTNKLIII